MILRFGRPNPAREDLGDTASGVGTEHPDTLSTADNLAVHLWDVGRVGEARVPGEETLERRPRVLGEDHPETRRTAAWLAELGAEQEEPRSGE